MSFKKARTKQDLIDDPRTYDVFSEGHRDWWVYLKAGYINVNSECGTIHEETIAECCAHLNEVRRASLSEIKLQGYRFIDAQERWREVEGCDHDRAYVDEFEDIRCESCDTELPERCFDIGCGFCGTKSSKDCVGAACHECGGRGMIEIEQPHTNR